MFRIRVKCISSYASYTSAALRIRRFKTSVYSLNFGNMFWNKSWPDSDWNTFLSDFIFNETFSMWVWSTISCLCILCRGELWNQPMTHWTGQSTWLWDRRAVCVTNCSHSSEASIYFWNAIRIDILNVLLYVGIKRRIVSNDGYKIRKKILKVVTKISNYDRRRSSEEYFYSKRTRRPSL